MVTRFHLAKSIDITKALKRDHDVLRRGLHEAAHASGEVALAAGALAAICLPHFELEERLLFPILARMQYLLWSEDTAAELADLHEHLATLAAEQAVFSRQHRSMSAAMESFLQAGYQAGDREAAELVHILAYHERMEGDLQIAAHELGSTTKSRM